MKTKILFLFTILISFSCSDNLIDIPSAETKITSSSLNKKVSWNMLRSGFVLGAGWYYYCSWPPINCMEEVVITGSPSSGGFDNFRGLFSESESEVNLLSSSATQSYFSSDSWESFIDGFNESEGLSYINLLQSGTVKIVENYNPMGNYIYLVLDDCEDEDDFTIDDVIFAIQIVQE